MAWVNSLYEQYGWLIDGMWSWEEVYMLWQAAGRIELWFAANGGDGRARMRGVFGEVTFKHAGNLWYLSGFSHVEGHTAYMVRDQFDAELVVHEMGHVYDNSFGTEWAAISGGGPADEMARDLGGFPEDCVIRFNCQIIGMSSGHYDGRYGYSTQEEKLQSGAYATVGPAEDFAEVWGYAVGKRDSSNINQRAQWLSSHVALQVAVGPTNANLPYRAIGLADSALYGAIVR